MCSGGVGAQPRDVDAGWVVAWLHVTRLAKSSTLVGLVGGDERREDGDEEDQIASSDMPPGAERCEFVRSASRHRPPGRLQQLLVPASGRVSRHEPTAPAGRGRRS